MIKIFVFIFFITAFSQKALAFQLDFPLACTIGQNCWVQQYVDHDTTTGVRDYRCGSVSYDGHDGTDFRVLNTQSSVDVLAAADGEVVGLRNSVTDNLVRDQADAAAVKNIECGNGVLLRHGEGFETQYCHMRRGSVAVKVGDTVKRGARLGQVGFSGQAAFPHLHFKVQKSGVVLDPFEGAAADDCGGDALGVWTQDSMKQLPYAASDILQFGWSAAPIGLGDLEEGRVAIDKVDRHWPALVATVWAINLQRGDEIKVVVTGPNGLRVENVETLERNKAQYQLFAGRKRRGDVWPLGTYQAEVTVRNQGVVRINKQIEVKIE